MKSVTLSPDSIDVLLEPVNPTAGITSGAADLSFGQAPGEYFLRQADELVKVRLKKPAKANELDAYLGSGRARWAEVRQVSKDGRAISLALSFFNGAVLEVGAVEVGLDDRAVAGAGRALHRRFGVERLGEVLEELCVLRRGPGDGDCYFLLTAGRAADLDFEAPPPEGGDEPDGAREQRVPSAERAFTIHGSGLRIAVAKKRVISGDEKYLAIRLTNALGGRADGALRLAHGRLRFSDFTRTGQVQALAAGAMAQLVEGESSYLKRWDEYGAKEGEMLLKRAREVGVLRWSNVQQVEHRGCNGVRFFFERDIPDSLQVGDSLEFAVQVPPYLENMELDWAAYARQLEAEFLAKKEAAASGQNNQEGGVEVGMSADVLDKRAQDLALDLSVAPSRGDLFLVLSLAGEKAQIERRMQARRRVLEGRSANPTLGLIIEEGGEPPEPARPSKLKPLTAFVREKIFKHAPTAKQREAISIALNTPDIALIQGPPGTGKTTVIAAIVERLNELNDKEGSSQGEVLVSAYQHDAIENMMARLTVNSTPVPKFGRRSGASRRGDRNREAVQQWVSEVSTRLRRRSPQLKTPDDLRQADLRCREYILAPSPRAALGLIDALLELPSAHLSERLADRARQLRERLSQDVEGSAMHDADTLALIWRLRTSPEGFADDGPSQAAMLLDLLDRLGDELPSRAREELKAAADYRGLGAPPFLADLRRLKAELLEWFQPRPAFRTEKPRKDVLDFVADARRHLQRRAGLSRSDSILSEFLYELEGNPQAVERVVEDYGFVFAATCQQSQGKDIRKRKGNAGLSAGTKADYDTVIVDEAARVGPRDLLVPMVQARRRIILVGDHRQLPHMIDKEIARSLEAEQNDAGSGDGPTEEDYIRQSMFQYLLGRLKQLQARDKVKRWVTLDKQFRMHPTLGKFVSDSFYRVHDEKEAFDSPLKADLFAHDLPRLTGAPAVWIDVPAQAGEERRAGTSRCRPQEAAEIAAWLDEWIDSPSGRRRTFGVISFYKAQCNDVLRELERGGYTERGPGNELVIARDYRLRPAEEGLPPEERLRIGTVDAFQGMEFDVVFLSMVRSRANVPKPSPDPTERLTQERRFFGHLTSANRLCVSMSRQRQLLVLVGDKAMLETELAKTAVPGLVAYLELCKTRGQVLGAREA